MFKIPTFSGRVIDVFDPDPGDVCIDDIAHGLANECRYGSQCRRFYSVAEHSVMVSRWAEALTVQRGSDSRRALEVARWGLLHDASEAYIGDVVVPVKRGAPWREEYDGTHKRLMLAVLKQFGLPLVEPEEVTEADRRMVVTEWPELIHRDLDYRAWNATPPEGFPGGLSCLLPDDAEKLFLHRYRALERRASKSPI